MRDEKEQERENWSRISLFIHLLPGASALRAGNNQREIMLLRNSSLTKLSSVIGSGRERADGVWRDFPGPDLLLTRSGDGHCYWLLSLVTGYWLLVTGYWLLVTGYCYC